MKKMAITMAAVILGMAGIADAATGSNSIVQDGIEYYIHTNKSVYHLGEQVEMLYRVTNLRDEDVTFGFPHSPEWNFWVEKDGEYIWRAVNGWWTVMTQFTLGPGDSKQFPTFDPTCIWNMRDNENNLVNLGEYTVIGGLYAGSGYYDYTKVAVSIEIVPATLLVPAEYPTIQAAIDAAYNGDTVLVADGTYTGPGNRDIDFLGKAITVRSESGPENCIIDCQGSLFDQHRGFYFRNGEDGNSIVQGFTIIHGVARYGGAIFCEFNSSPTITNCIINGNLAVGRSGESSYGGGIDCHRSSPTITNCTISNNSASYGGGIICRWDSNAVISNCTISNNSARELGGGISCLESSPTITNCIINNNLKTDGSWGGGGGISCGGASPIITGCTISDNMSAAGGGAIYCEESNPTIRGCTITGNSAEVGGGIACNDYSSPTITNCTINGNSADEQGGAMLNWGSSPMITNCTFAENSALNGNALAFDSWKQQHPSNLQLTNCILADSGNEIWNNDNSTITITYSDVQGGYTGEGNIDTDPYFVEPGYWDTNNTPDDANDDSWVDGDYYLLPDSLCIDAGDPDFIPEPDETDLDGNPRVIGGRIDMGAYESNYIQAAMKLTPQTLNCASKGKYIKAHLTLPEEFLPEDVDVNEPAVAEPMGAESEYIKVLGTGTGPVRLEICFDREAFCAQITETGEIEITVIGSLTTGRYFYASDTIKIKPQHQRIIYSYKKNQRNQRPLR